MLGNDRSSVRSEQQSREFKAGWQSTSWALILVAVLLAALAQWALDARNLPLGFVGYVLGATLFTWLVRGIALEKSVGPREMESSRTRLTIVVIALVLGGLSFPLFRGNRFSAFGTMLWVGGLLLLLWGLGAFADVKFWVWWKRWWLSLRGGRITVPVDVFALASIMGVGAFYRWYRLREIPLEMGCDLPLIYRNIKQILAGQYPIFFPSVPGREGLFFYLVAPYARLFGLDHYIIKLVCTYIGLLTIPVVYVLAKELYGRGVGLFAAALLSVSKWHIMLSRVGFRAIVMPLCVALLWYFLVRGAESGARNYFIWAGLVLGLGLYTYNAFLIVPFGVLLCLGLHSLTDHGKLVRRHRADILWMYVVMLFVFIPLGRYAFENPRSYFFRVATRITGIEAPLPRNPFLVLLDNIRKTALMFNLQGDVVFVCNVPFQRHLGYVSAIAFVLGLAYCLARWRRGYNAMTLGFLIFTAMPTTLSIAFPQEVPNAVRANAAMIPALVLAALPFEAFSRYLVKVINVKAEVLLVGVRISSSVNWQVRIPLGSALRLIPTLIIVGALLYETVAVYPTYFEQYVAHLPYRNYSISLAMAKVIDDFADDGEAYVVTRPYWYDGNALRAQLRIEEQTWHNEVSYLDPGQPPLSHIRGKVLFIVHPEDRGSLEILRGVFPKGIALEHRDFDGNLSFIAFYGERN